MDSRSGGQAVSESPCENSALPAQSSKRQARLLTLWAPRREFACLDQGSGMFFSSKGIFATTRGEGVLQMSDQPLASGLAAAGKR